MKLVLEEEITMELQNAFVLKVCFLKQSVLKFSKIFKPCQVRGGGGHHLPYLSWLWSKFWPKDHVSLKAGINSNSFGFFSELFFQITKKLAKIENLSNIAKKEQIFQICNFWAISACNTSKESIFLIEFKSKQKREWFEWRKIEKKGFSNFL